MSDNDLVRLQVEYVKRDSGKAIALPLVAAYDPRHLNLRYAVLRTKLSLACSTTRIDTADCRNLRIGQLRAPVLFSAKNSFWEASRPMRIASWSTLWMKARSISISPRATIGVLSTSVPVASCCAPFGAHVARVVAIRTKEKMAGSDAGRNVAVMTHQHALRNRPIRHDPRRTVRQRRLPAETCHAIASEGARATPQPTGGGLFDVEPKSDLQLPWFLFNCHGR